MIGLSVLICHLQKRSDKLGNLINQISEYKKFHSVEIIIDSDSGESSIGEKRNRLLAKAQGKYLAFIDDDDRISEKYFDLIFEGIEKDVDCCSLVGEITFDGKGAKPFIHSIKYNKYWEDERAYYRYPNHLNCIKSEIAKQFSFPMISHGEDTSFATKIFKAGVLNIEHNITDTIYYYDYISNK